MSRFIVNDKGIMGLTLSQIGLIIATGILLSAVFSFLFFNDWYKTAELRNIANSFSTLVEGMDSRFFENTTVFYFPDKNYRYNVSISTEYIIVESEGNWRNKLSIKESFLRKPWLRQTGENWTNGEELHIYLNTTYSCYGEESDPIKKTHISSVKNYLNNLRDTANKSFALKPFYIDINKPVYIDKVYIFYDNNGDGSWDKNLDEKQGFLVIYQL
ncbi:MAG: hypothetical protein DRM98_01685 [Thermoplasmata archaeon]|nr:MAG: hypothetical protein DRM98_01685 [Thermoplasmata archaeon]RLF51169.1 MAG: hypothetical protein DRN24_05400 [Thermoplasmata archaeon]